MESPANIELPRGKHRFRYWLTLGVSIVLGLVFITSGVGKLLGEGAFLLNILSLPLIPQRLATTIVECLPWVELILGVCLIIGIAIQFVALLSTVLIAIFISYNAWMVAHGFGYKPCGCLGILDRVFLGQLSTTNSLYIDIGLIILALIIYFCYQGNFFDVRPWFLRRAERQIPEQGGVN